MQKKSSTAKPECMCEIVKKNNKKNWGLEFFKPWNFHFLKLKLNLLQIIFFLIFPVSSSSVCNKKETWVLGLVSKIDAIDGKKWVKFVAMQQNSAILIYDFNRMKVKERFLKKGPFKTGQFHAPEKSHLVLKVSKKPRKLFWATLKIALTLYVWQTQILLDETIVINMPSYSRYIVANQPI